MAKDGGLTYHSIDSKTDLETKTSKSCIIACKGREDANVQVNIFLCDVQSEVYVSETYENYVSWRRP
jgi:hypothetical protein